MWNGSFFKWIMPNGKAHHHMPSELVIKLCREINDLRESLYDRNEELSSMSKEMQRIGAEREEYAEEIEKLKAELGQKEGELAKTKGKLNEIVNGLDANKVKLGWIVEFEDGVIEHLQKEANQ